MRADTDAPVFAQYEWFAAYLTELEPEPERVRLLELRQDGVLRGVLPLMWLGTPRPWPGAAVLRLPRGTCLDITALPLEPGERLGDWWHAIRAELARHGIRFFAIRANGWPLFPAPSSVLQGAEDRVITRVQGRSCWFDCTQPHAVLESRYAKALKKILKHARHGLEAFGPVELRAVGLGESLRWAFDEFLRLEASGWKGARGSATALLIDERSRHFFEALFFREPDTFEPRVNLLLVSGQPIAAQLCLRRGSTLHVMKIAFDQSLARHSPGSLLLNRVLAEACEDPAIHIVSLVTGQPWMDLWQPTATPVADLWLFSHAVFAEASRLALRARDRRRALAAERSRVVTSASPTA